jgi:glutamate decarboxylase
MVHLASVPNDSAVNAPLVKGMEKVKIDPNNNEDEVTASVYGSRFAVERLPMHEMPEDEMPKEIAYRMIRDDLSLDGNPILNLASFVTTYMVCVHLYTCQWIETSGTKEC